MSLGAGFLLDWRFRIGKCELISSDAELQTSFVLQEYVEIANIRETSDDLIAIDSPFVANDGG